jgi:hypothetical protein
MWCDLLSGIYTHSMSISIGTIFYKTQEWADLEGASPVTIPLLHRFFGFSAPAPTALRVPSPNPNVKK